MILEAGARIGLEARTLDAVRALSIDEPLATRLGEVLATRDEDDAIAEVRGANVEATLGRDGARTFYLALALAQVPAAEARHRAHGVPSGISLATLADLGVWVRHFRAQIGIEGITLEILGWAQRYLRGELYRVSALQFDLRPFVGTIRVRRHRVSRALSITTLDDHAIDPATGEIGEARPTFDDAWDVLLEPGTPALDMHIPANTFVTLRSTAHSIRDGFAFFESLGRTEVPVGACGEAWLLDPSVRALLPRNKGLHAVQRACCLFPSPLPEAKTVRRLFGPDVSRADLATWPRDEMNTLQRALADFLAIPTNTLRARGGFILREELAALPVWGPIED